MPPQTQWGELTLDDEQSPLLQTLQRSIFHIYFTPPSSMVDHHMTSAVSNHSNPTSDVKKFKLQLVLFSTCSLENQDEGQPSSRSSCVDLTVMSAGSFFDQSQYYVMVRKPSLMMEALAGVTEMYFYMRDDRGIEYKSKIFRCNEHQAGTKSQEMTIDSNLHSDHSLTVEKKQVLKKLKESPLGSTLSEPIFNQFLSHLFDKFDQSTCELFGTTFPLFGNYDIQNCSFTLIDGGTKRDSALHSFCRFSRILMSLHLGKSLLFVRLVNFKKHGQPSTVNSNNSFPTKTSSPTTASSPSSQSSSKLSFTETQNFNSSLIERACTSPLSIPSQKGKYHFFATSISGTKGDTCCFVHENFNLQHLRNLLGDFSRAEKSGPCKTFSRMALNFGKCLKSERPLCEEKEVCYLSSKEEEEFPGTDGIGFIHEELAHELLLSVYKDPYDVQGEKSKTKLLFKEKRELRGIGAIQVRYAGCKGVLQLIPASYWSTLQKQYNLSDAIRVVFRDSMVKFNGNTQIYPYMDILNYSSIQGGYMNRNDMSCLLIRSSRPKEMQQVFQQALKEYLNEMIERKEDPSFICNQLFPIHHEESTMDSMEMVIHSMVMAGQRLDNPFLQKRIHKKIKCKFQSLLDDSVNLRILFPCVDLIAEIDESRALNDDEIYVPCEKLIQDLGFAEYQKLEFVIAYRQPLTYEGDFQKFKLVKNPQNEFLKSRVNSVVFPKLKGRKSPHQFMAGGDLDG